MNHNIIGLDAVIGIRLSLEVATRLTILNIMSALGTSTTNISEKATAVQATLRSLVL